jgi:hypothetical protein
MYLPGERAKMRAADADRDRVVGLLNTAYTEGRHIHTPSACQTWSLRPPGRACQFAYPWPRRAQTARTQA